MTILNIAGDLNGTLDTTGTSPQALAINIHAVTYNKIQNVGTLRLLGNPTLTLQSPIEISLGTSLYFKNNGTLAHSGLTDDVIVQPDGTSARFYGHTYSINPTLNIDVNDWSPTGLGTANTIKINATAYSSVSGIATGAEGRQLIMHNTGTMPVKLLNQGTASVGTNRLQFGRDVFLGPNESITVHYDSLVTNWRSTQKLDTSDCEYFGTGIDGDVIINSGTTVLERDMYYRNLTIAGGTLLTAGCKIFVSEILDISAATTNSVMFTEPSALDNGGFVPGRTLGGGGPGLVAGTTGDRSGGGNGGLGGGCDADQLYSVPIYKFADGVFLGILGGCGGAESGIGDSGSGGGVIYISSRYISRGSNSAQAIIHNPGGTGYNGGGGGWTYIAYGQLLGNTITNALTAHGGVSNHIGGNVGTGGRITAIDLYKNSASETLGTSIICAKNL